MKSVKLNLNDQIIISQKKNEFIDLDQIIMLKSESNYTKIFLSNGQFNLTALTLKHYDKILTDRGFLRINRSYLINKAHIQRHIIHGAQIILSNGFQTAIARRRRLKKIEVNC